MYSLRAWAHNQLSYFLQKAHSNINRQIYTFKIPIYVFATNLRTDETTTNLWYIYYKLLNNIHICQKHQQSLCLAFLVVMTCKFAISSGILKRHRVYFNDCHWNRIRGVGEFYNAIFEILADSVRTKLSVNHRLWNGQKD